MELQLIDGVFNRTDALAIISRMIEAKINFHESKIGKSSGEDDIKMRETKIKQLQEQWHHCRQQLQGEGEVQVTARIQVDS